MSHDEIGRTVSGEGTPREPKLADEITAETEESGSDVKEHQQASALEESDRQKMFSRRALLQAGWSIPLFLAIGLPDELHGATADCNHNDHTDTPEGYIDEPSHHDGLIQTPPIHQRIKHGDHDDHCDKHHDHGNPSKMKP